MKKLHLIILFVLISLLSYGKDCSRFQILNLKDSVSQGSTYVYFEMTIDTVLLQNSGYTDLYFVDNANDTITTYGSWSYYIPDATNNYDTLNYLIPFQEGITSFPDNFNGYLKMRNPDCDIPYNNLATSIDNLNENIISVYPNPVNDILKISVKNSEIGKIGKLSIFDYSGRLVYNQKNVALKIDMSWMDPGIYYLEITSINKDQIIKRIIKL